MLKKLHFEGCIMVDMEKEKPNIYDYEDRIRSAISDHGCDDMELTVVDIKSIEDIPVSWLDALPYSNRNLGDMTCAEIINAEMAYKKKMATDPNQTEMKLT